MSTRLNTVTNVVLLICCSMLSILVGLRLWTDRTGRNSASPPLALESMEPQKISISTKNGPSKGSPSAKLALVEFSDFQCPFCGRFARDTFPLLQRDYVDTGRVRYVFRNLPLAGHSHAVGAARAAECAHAQGRFWEMHDRLFANQQALAAADLVTHAAAMDLDDKKFQRCVQSSTNSSIDSDQSEAARLGLTSTPTFLVGVIKQDGIVEILKKINGAQPYEVFKEALDDTADSLESIASKG